MFCQKIDWTGISHEMNFCDFFGESEVCDSKLGEIERACEDNCSYYKVPGS